MDESHNYVNKKYEYNGVIYEVLGTEEFHNKMITDWNFATSYFAKITTQPSREENVKSHEDANEQLDETDMDMDDGTTWDNAGIKFLLHEYAIRKEKFRNPKIKKLKLWREIAAEFQKHNLKFSADNLAKKFGNMKTTYAKIKKNNSKRTTGAGRKPWAWFALMDTIFHADLSINFRDDVVMSMPGNDYEILDLSKTALTFFIIYYRNENGLETSNGTQAEALNDVDDINCSDEVIERTSTNKHGRKNIHYHRQKQLDLDCHKLQIMQQFNEKLEATKNVQKECISIWNAKITDLTDVLRERNELLKEIIKYQK